MGYFDSSDEESDYSSDEEVRRPKMTSKKNKKKKSFLDDTDSESDSDDSFLGEFRKKRAKAVKRKQQQKFKSFESDATETTQESTETLAEQSEGEEQLPVKEGYVYRETTMDWVETMKLLRKKKNRNKRGACNVRFADVLVTDMLEYQQLEDSVRSVNDETHVAVDHDEIPWYDQDYEELPWYEQPDLDEDDALTALCKKVLAAGDDGEENQRRLSEQAARVEAKVLGFALKLRSRVSISAAS